ncbi:MAG: substrate-binding domain-containing protein [Planctomycetota bacterium]
MRVTEIRQTSMKEYVYERLVEEIVGEQQASGTRLPTVQKLADRFDTSVYTVQKALDMLEEEGYIEKKRGSGSFVADSSAATQMADTVAVCMRPEAHVWGELSHLLSDRLHDDHVLPVQVNPENDNAPEIMRRLARSDARAFVLVGSPHSPRETLEGPLFRQKIILGLVEWVGRSFPDLLRVLVDYRHGGELVAEHLYERGHRKMLMVAAPIQARKMRDVLDGGTGPHGRGIEQNDHGVALLNRWRELGAEWEVMATDTGAECERGLVGLDEDEFLSRWEGSDAPTAVFGWRDVDAAAAQRTLRKKGAELLEDVEIAGYFNTPWSRGAHPPFTSVDLNLEAIVEKACNLLEARLRGDDIEQDTLWVEPELIVR